MGQPLPATTGADGTIFKRQWWRYFRQAPKFSQIVQSWDTAFKTGNENSFSVCTTWGVAEDGYYLQSVWRDRAEFPELRRMMITLAELWKPHAVLVEDRASGQSLLQEFKSATKLPVVPVKVDSDKFSRAQAVTAMIEAGKVFVPETAPWLRDFIDELASFPKGLYDDAVDSTTQALNYLRQQSSRPGSTIISGYTPPGKLDKEELWEKAMAGYAMSPEEIARM